MEVLPSSPPVGCLPGSKKRRRSIEPLESAKILGIPRSVLPEALRSVVLPPTPTSTTDDDAAALTETDSDEEDLTPRPALTPQDVLLLDDEADAALPPATTAALDVTTPPTSRPRASKVPKTDAELDVPALIRRSLMGLSLQLKLKTMLVEAWASDMNNVVIERNLFAIAKELALLKELGVYDEPTCVKFVTLARERMAQLLDDACRRESLQMDAEQMWTMAVIQAQEIMCVRASLDAHPDGLDDDNTRPSSEFPLLCGLESSSRDIAVLWKAMSIARDRGAQLWHENKPEEALPFLVAADSYMKRFTLKYQRLKIDHAMLDTLQSSPLGYGYGGRSRMPSPQRARPKRVSFAAQPEVLGIADPEVDRSPICPTKPSKLESLLLRTSREFPTPGF